MQAEESSRFQVGQRTAQSPYATPRCGHSRVVQTISVICKLKEGAKQDGLGIEQLCDCSLVCLLLSVFVLFFSFSLLSASTHVRMEIFTAHGRMEMPSFRYFFFWIQSLLLFPVISFQ